MGDLVDALVANLPLAGETTRNTVMDGLLAAVQEEQNQQAPVEIHYVEVARLWDGSSVVTGLDLQLRDGSSWRVLQELWTLRILPEPEAGVAHGRSVVAGPPDLAMPGIAGLRVRLRFGWYDNDRY